MSTSQNIIAARQRSAPRSAATRHLPALGRAQRPSARWTRPYVAALVAVDIVAALVCVLVFVSLVSSPAPAVVLVAGIAAWPVLIAALGGYSADQIGVGSSEFAAVIRAAASLVVAAALAEAVFNLDVVRLTVGAVIGASAVGLLARFVARKVVHYQQNRGRLLRGVIAVGSISAVRHLTTVLQREPHCGLEVVGVCVPEDQLDAALDAGLPVVGDSDRVAEAVQRTNCEGVAVTSSQSPDFLRRLSWSLEASDVDLLVHPGVVEVSGPRMHLRPHVGLPLVHVNQPNFAGWRRVVKRGTDVVLSSIAVLLAAPLLLAVAAAIKLTDRGPVFFCQTRVGLDGKEFTMYKFRSMVVNAEAKLAELAAQNEGAGVLFKMADDPRITPVGKFLRRYSLDELPQLFNVLRGSMSLVGPRPPLPVEVAEYATEVHRRLLVQPGLTGLWQVSGRSLLSWEEAVRLDLRYVENWSLSLDVLLMWKTVWAVLAKRGAF